MVCSVVTFVFQYPPTTLPIFGRPGGDIIRAGTRTSAKGTVSSKSGKQALGEALDGHVADLATVGSESKPGKSKRQRGNPKAKATPKRDEVGKKLQKDIKASLSFF